MTQAHQGEVPADMPIAQANQGEVIPPPHACTEPVEVDTLLHPEVLG